ncbi:MAG: metallophosphoesterase [Methanomicrobia archaeon]|nr:metallophosphoesterase [Methanomicrobia archaeon]
MKIAHISDIHAAEAYFLPELAENVIAKLNELEPEILVVTGDLTIGGYPHEFERARRFIDRIACEVSLVIPGNHDVRNLGYLGFETIFGPRSKVERYREVTLVGIDSAQPDLDEGHVGREKYEWLERCLTHHPDDLNVVALHHHVIPVPKTGRELNILTDAGDLLELLMRCHVDLVLCGHKHVPWVWNLDGMVIVNAGTVCSNRVKWQIPQSFNLIELDDRKRGAIDIFRISARGEQELVFSRGHEEEDAV